MRMTIGSGITMDFFYDQNGQPYAMKYNNQLLYYVLNQQGDVVRLVNSSGTSYGIYTYDAWGNILTTTGSMASTLGQINPLRYRGYVYDVECNLYYLQSRYYDPAIGRFINADVFASTGQGILGNNMFAYCNNSPVNKIDPSGEAGWFVAANAIYGAAVGIITQISANVISGTAWHSGILGAATGGATYNVVALTTGNIALASASGSAVEAITNEALNYVTGEKEVTTENVLSSAANIACTTAENAVTASITGNIASKIVHTNSKWFQPQKMASSFTGNYGMRVFFQTAIQGELTMFFNSIKKASQVINTN